MKISLYALVAFALILTGCAGTRGTTQSVNFQMPNRAMLVTNGYTRGDLVVSARFITDDQVEIISARYSYLGSDGYWVTYPASRSLFNRHVNGEWTGSISWDMGFAYELPETVVEKRQPTTICGWTFTPAVLIPGAETASVQYLQGSPSFLPVLGHTSPLSCVGDFQPQWVVAMSDDGKRLLAIGSPSNSRYTDEGGRVALPMAVLEKH